MKKLLLFTILLLVLAKVSINAQTDSLFSKISFESDFRFRAEQDWDSKKSDGYYREDRTRLRYRLRVGAKYSNDWYTLGFRIRSGDPNKQQDPQLTLGEGFEEFGTLPIGFEKFYFKGKHKTYSFWLGKNDFSFEKNNELFWSDNVYPEGIYLKKKFNVNSQSIESISLQGSHYILSSTGNSLSNDAYFQGFQSLIQFTNDRFRIFPALYLMRNIPNIPDGNHFFDINYTIVHIGAKLKALKEKKLFVEFDLYHNVEDYSSEQNIRADFVDEKTAYSIGIQYGTLKNEKDWKFKITYTELQKFAALDYMAQNDWARWDYSANNSPDGRLTNFKGVEVVAGYQPAPNINIIAKYYFVNQLVPDVEILETGQRVRLDFNVRI